MTDERGRPDESSSADDAVIGRAFRWSVLVILVVVVLVALGWWALREAPVQEAVVEKQIVPVADLDQSREEMPKVRFVDITEAAGIDFVHSNGARGEKLLPESMGAGAAFFDYDADGDQDLFLVNSTTWPGDPAPSPVPRSALYRNDGSGRFDDVTREVGLAVTAYGTGVAVGDYDNDGDVDLFLTTLGPNRLFENEGGTFRDVSSRSGTAGEGDAWSSSAGFFDYDNDGDLDLFVCNYVRWSREIDIELDFTLNGRDRAYGPPTNYAGAQPYLYRNDGDGKFADVSAEAGVQVVNPLDGQPMAKALGVAFADVDGNGFLDIIVANDTVQNLLFLNGGDGRFEESGVVAGIGFDGAGKATGAMGIDTGHHRNDEQFAVAIGNFANEMSSLYVTRGAGLGFTDEAAGEGVGAPSRGYLSFGLFFFDYDLDGRLDLLQANGHLEDEIQQVQESQHYLQPAQLFWNVGPDALSCFAEVPGETTGDLSRPIVGRGATYADIDGDGDQDVLLTQAGRSAVLLRNDQQSGHHWLRVVLEGDPANRCGIGAWVELETSAGVQRRQVMPTRSYLSQVELPLTFGLGESDTIRRLSVDWPGGASQEFTDVAVDRTLRIRQARSTPSEN